MSFFKQNRKTIKPLVLPINYDDAHWAVRKQARIQYIDEQKGKCQHCGNMLNGQPTEDIMCTSINRLLFPKGFFKNPIHLHHDHNTGLTISAIHARCNAVLWQYLNQ